MKKHIIVGSNIILSVIILLAVVGCFIFYLLPIVNINLTYEASIYFMLSISTIILPFVGLKIACFLHWLQDLNNKDQCIMLSKKLYNANWIKLGTYFVYLILIIFFNSTELNGILVFPNVKLPNVILQSFATFIAFDRLKSMLAEKKNKKT